MIKKLFPYLLLLLFFLIFSCGATHEKKEDSTPVITSQSNEGNSLLVGVVDEGVSSRDVENRNTYSEFIDFPESFQEDNIVPIKATASQRKNKNEMFGVVQQKTKRISKKPRKKIVEKKNNLSLAKVRKMYYSGDHRKLVSVYFSSNELDKLYYKGLSYLMLAQQSPNKSKYYVAKAKFIFDRIGRTADKENLKAKSLLWLSIAELQYPNTTKSFSKRIYPLRYIVEKLSNSRIVNDAQLYLALFHQQNKDYQQAISYFYRVRESDKDNLVYDFNLKRMVPPTVAVEYYLRQLEAISGNIFLNDSATSKNIGSSKAVTARKSNRTTLENVGSEDGILAVSPTLATPASSDNENTDEEDMTEIEKKIDEFRKGNDQKSAKLPEVNGEDDSYGDPYFFTGDDEEIFFEDSQQGSTNSDAINQEVDGEKITTPSTDDRTVPLQDKIDSNAGNVSTKAKGKDNSVEAVGGAANLPIGIENAIGRTPRRKIVEEEFVFE